jgi:hypothetical protein
VVRIQKGNGYTIVMGELPVKPLLGLPRIWENAIQMDFRKMGCNNGIWMELERIVLDRAVLNLQVLLP